MHVQKNKFLALLTILLIICLGPYSIAQAQENENPNEQPLLQFPVLSDIHISSALQQKESFKNALSDMNTIAPEYKAMVLLGDITDYGKEQQYDDLNRIISAYGNKNAEIMMTIGNHEYFDGAHFPGFIPEKYQQRFIEKTGMPGIYYDKWVEGYHFITLGSEGFPDDDDDHALISDEQYSWLQNTLAEGADSAKPIFVFLHQAIDNTVYGSEEWGAGFTDDRLLTLLREYPQVIFFSGHSHYVLNHPRTIYQNGFTMVNAGSVAYAFTDRGYVGNSQGLLVNVYANRVEIRAREFTDHTDIQTFTVKSPFEQTYGESTRPIFNPGSNVKIEKNTSGESVTLSFDAAKDNSFINQYVIKQDGEVFYTSYTDFLNNSITGKQTIEIKNLTPMTKYDWVISAVDAWNNKSFNTLKVSFTTPELNGWKKENGKWIYYEKGKQVIGWKLIDGTWYFFDRDGWMVTGWVAIGTQKYYLNDSGAMQVGFKVIDGKTYYFGSDGALKKGWVYDQNKWYYLDLEGVPKVGWVFDSGKWYYLKLNGMVTGWVQDGNVWYFTNGKGEMQTGWVYTGGKWYFHNNSGAMQTGWVNTGDKWYLMEPSGAMLTGWIYEKGKWYFLNNSGAMVTGWSYIGGKWYDFKSDGSLV